MLEGVFRRRMENKHGRKPGRGWYMREAEKACGRQTGKAGRAHAHIWLRAGRAACG